MVVDKMFDSFQNFGYDFNRDAAGTELELNWIRPVLTREVSPQQPSGQAVFSGRLSTRRWTMIVKGTSQEVLAFILPADKLIGFNLSSTHYVPYFKLLPTSDGLDVRWKIGKTVLTPELLQRVFQDLFVSLIKHAKGDIRGTEKFDPKKLGISQATPKRWEPRKTFTRSIAMRSLKTCARCTLLQAITRRTQAQRK